MTDTTMCETLGRRSARRSNCRVEECKELYKYSYNLPGAFAHVVTIAIEAVGTPPTNANWQRKHSASAHRSNHRQRVHVSWKTGAQKCEKPAGQIDGCRQVWYNKHKT